MPKPPLPDVVTQLLGRPNPAVIATLRPDGQPVTVATWYLMEDDGRVMVNMDANRRRLDYIRADPRVSVTVLDADDWSRHVSLQGRVAELRDDTDLTGIDRLARRYTGHPFGARDVARVSAWLVIETWHAWDVFAR
jgi:PPOX class probable F420-dependent enzyme